MAPDQEKPILFLNLLGIPEILLGNEPVTLGTAKAKALLFYLAATGQPHSRSVLVNLLWGEMAEARARRNLTATLTNLRKVIPSYLEVESNRVAFRQDSPYQLDVDYFQEQVTQGKATQDMRLLREAVARYRGDFLEGLIVKDGITFEEWVYAQREQFREQHLQSLQWLVDDAVDHGDYASGLDYAHQLLALDPWRETAHRQLMILHAQNDRREAALAQYEACRQVLAEELGVDPSPETMAVHQDLLEANSAPTHNLPPAPNNFVGRTTEIRRILHHLADSACRLLTIVGPGGVGKTRLALEAGRCYTGAEADLTAFGLNDKELRNAGFGDGVYFVSVAEISHGSQIHADQLPLSNDATANSNATNGNTTNNAIVTAIAQSIGYSFSGSNPPQEQLLNYLASRSMILIIDNFEELLQGEISQPALLLLSAFLSQVPYAKLLVTSRIRLKLKEEWVLTIDGLPYPAKDEVTKLTSNIANDTNKELSNPREYAAVNLFIQRAEQVSMGFSASTHEVHNVVRICELLEGLPLGLELAANWVTYLSCSEIVDEIEQGIDILSTDLHNLPDRHRSLRAVIEYSWRLLTPQEQVTLCQLAVFRGGFTKEAAKEVTGASLHMLVRLVDQALLRRAGDDTSARRHDMHSLIRQFAIEKLQALEGQKFISAWEDSAMAHAIYFANFAQLSYDRYLAGEYPIIMPMMTVDNDNLLGAWRWLTDQIQQQSQHEQEQMLIIETLMRMIHPLAWFYRRRVRYAEGIDTLGLADEALNRALQKVDLSISFKRTYGIARAMIQIRLAMLRYYLGSIDRAEALLQDALPVVRAESVPEEELHGLGELSKCTRRRGDYDQTKAIAQRCESLSRQLGSRLGQIMALTTVAVTAADEGDYNLAEDAGKKVVDFYRHLNDTANLTMTQSNLANTYIRQKKFKEAKPLLEEAYSLAQKEGNLFSIVMTGTNLSSVASGLGDDEQAERYAQEALSQAKEIGNQRWAGTNLNQLSRLHAKKKAWQAAEAYAQDALAISAAIPSETDSLSALSSLAHAWAYQGKVEQAMRLFQAVQQHPSTVQFDKHDNEPLFQELQEELPASHVSKLESWAKETSIEDVISFALSHAAPKRNA
ncbi:MAG: BTAD domain-containing putative transcriptional regulator [Chloroflexota bacterium]